MERGYTVNINTICTEGERKYMGDKDFELKMSEEEGKVGEEIDVKRM